MDAVYDRRGNPKLPERWAGATVAALGAGLIFAAYCRLHMLLAAETLPWHVSLAWGAWAGAPAGLLAWCVWRLGPRTAGGAGRTIRPLRVAGLVLVAVALGGAMLHGAAQGVAPWRIQPEAIFRLLPVAALAALASALRVRGRRSVSAPDPAPAWIELPGARHTCVRAQDIDLVSAAGNYCEVRAGGRTYLVRIPLSELVRQLACHGLVQVHRSAAINCRRLVALKPQPPRGRLVAELDSGATVRIGGAYAQALTEALRSVPPSAPSSPDRCGTDAGWHPRGTGLARRK
jgi:DNA-binding LytR/AlgR family response regulator